MRVNGYKCEICLNVIDVDFHKTRFPDGWFSLEYLVEGNELEELHFCCIPCLKMWISKQEKEEAIKSADTGGPVIALSNEEYKRRFGKNRRVEKPLSSQSMQVNNAIPGE